MLNIALPTGRMGDQAYQCFAAIGYGCKEMEEQNRRLVFIDEERQLRYMLVKPSDVAMYVEYGAADIGVVGRDVIMESRPDIYELLDLGFGKCRFAVAAPEGWHDDNSRPLKVATTYVRVAQEYFYSIGRQIETIRLHGSVELAPLIGLADVIVDIVESGATLRENKLQIVAEIAPSSARLIANKSSYQFNYETINQIKNKMERSND
jgi:ATP phosphoribosyltransferase